MSIKKVAEVKAENKNYKVNAYFVVKIINYVPQVYNIKTNTWNDFLSGNGSLFKNKTEALCVVNRLCNEDHKNPIFLTSCECK